MNIQHPASGNDHLLHWPQPQTGRNAMNVSGVAYRPEQCEDLTIDETVQFGPRQ